jgi:hypothetical protein
VKLAKPQSGVDASNGKFIGPTKKYLVLSIRMRLRQYDSVPHHCSDRDRTKSLKKFTPLLDPQEMRRG